MNNNIKVSKMAIAMEINFGRWTRILKIGCEKLNSISWTPQAMEKLLKVHTINYLDKAMGLPTLFTNQVRKANSPSIEFKRYQVQIKIRILRCK